MDKFKVGDVVRMKSGGPKMTVFFVTSDHSDTVHTQYFTDDNFLREARDLKIVMLDLVKKCEKYV
jgi:uncharacterized protein YodC (DUF2158 family)